MSAPKPERSRDEVERLIRDNVRIVFWCLKRFRDTRPMRREDLEPVGMEALWRAAVDWDPERGNFFNLAATCIKRAFKDELTYHRAQGRTAILQPITEDWQHTPAPRPGPDEQAETQEAADQVEYLLGLLPRRQARVLRRLFLDGISMRTLARQMNVSHQRIAQIVSEARVRLKRIGERQ